MVYHALHDLENKVSCTLVLFMKPHDILYILYTCISIICHRHFFCIHQGRMQNFKLGAHLKQLRRAEGGVKIFVEYRVKNHDFMPGAPPPPGSAPV